MTNEQLITAKYNKVMEAMQRFDDSVRAAIKPKAKEEPKMSLDLAISLLQIKVKSTPCTFVEMAAEKLAFQLETFKLLKEIEAIEEEVENHEEVELEVRSYDLETFPVMDDLPLQRVATKRFSFSQWGQPYFDYYPIDRVPYSFVAAAIITGDTVNINNRRERQIQKGQENLARMREIFRTGEANRPTPLEAMLTPLQQCRIEIDRLVAVEKSRTITATEKEIEQQVDNARNGKPATNHYLINLYFKRISELQAIEAKKTSSYRHCDPRPRDEDEDLIDMIMMIGQPEPPPRRTILG